MWSRVPTWSRSSRFENSFTNPLLFISFVKARSKYHFLCACFSIPPQNESFLSSCCHEMLLYRSIYWALPNLTTASKHAYVIHQGLRSSWFIPKMFLSVFCVPRAALCVENKKLNDTASSMGFPNRRVGRDLGLDLKCTATLLTTKQ